MVDVVGALRRGPSRIAAVVSLAFGIFPFIKEVVGNIALVKPFPDIMSIVTSWAPQVCIGARLGKFQADTGCGGGHTFLELMQGNGYCIEEEQKGYWVYFNGTTEILWKKCNHDKVCFSLMSQVTLLIMSDFRCHMKILLKTSHSLGSWVLRIPSAKVNVMQL